MEVALRYNNLGTLTVLILALTSCPPPFVYPLKIPTADPLPRIQIEDWLESGELEWKSKEEGLEIDPDMLYVDGSKFVITPYVAALVVACEAPYPVEWRSSIGSHMSSRSLYLIQGKVVRKAGDVFSESTFRFISYIQFRGHVKEMTGSYTCQKVRDPLLSSTVHMFWEGISPSLVLSPRTLEVRAPRNAKSLVLPCYTSSPNLTVSLYKSVIDMFYIEHFFRLKSEFTSFDATKGFILNLTNMPDVAGVYKCASNDSADFIDIKVTQDIIDGAGRNHHVDKIERNASFTFNSLKGSIYCCSKSSLLPSLNSFICTSPTVCNFLGDDPFGKNVSSLVLRARARRKNDSCVSIRMRPGLLGHFQCKGDGIDVIRTLYTSYPSPNGAFSVFTSWNGVNRTEMIRMVMQENYVQVPYVTHWRDSGRGFVGTSLWRRRRYRYRPWRPYSPNNLSRIPRTIYTGESITFRCQAPTTYFAHGSKFVIRWKNNTFEQIPSTDGFRPTENNAAYIPSWQQYGHFGSLATFTTTISSDMSAIICYAPVYNSTEWVTKEIPVRAKDPVPPTFTSGSSTEVIHWTLNDTKQSLRCGVEGEPRPNVTLYLNSKEVVNSTNVNVTTVNATVVMTVSIVSHDFHGEYSCVAYNLGGYLEKKIVVYVEEPKETAWITAVVSVICVGLLIGLTAIGWLYWRRRRLTRQ